MVQFVGAWRVRRCGGLTEHGTPNMGAPGTQQLSMRKTVPEPAGAVVAVQPALLPAFTIFFQFVGCTLPSEAAGLGAVGATPGGTS